MAATSRGVHAGTDGGEHSVELERQLAHRTLADRTGGSGFLLFDASTGASAELRRTALWAARDQLARAIEVHPQYADPRCFLAVIAADASDGETASAERDRCFDLDPPVQLRTLVDESVAGP